jgi:hypothetical protein
MKIIFPKRGRYVLTDTLTIPNNRWRAGSRALKAALYGWGVDIPFTDILMSDGSINDSIKCSIQIPAGNIITISSFILTSYRDEVKLALTQKENPHLKTKVDVESFLRGIRPNILPPTVVSQYRYRGIEYSIQQVKQARLNWELKTSLITSIECEEYNG